MVSGRKDARESHATAESVKQTAMEHALHAVQRKVAPTRALPPTTTRAEAAVWTLRHADAVCFDVDSTVCRDEAIDELANFVGKGEVVAALTRKAMNGNASFRDALAERLHAFHPSRQQLERYVHRHPPKLTPGIVELARTLRRRGADVYLVSGGFRRIIRPVAARLAVPLEHVFANSIVFDAAGEYAGFDEAEPTSASGGKARVCGLLKQRHGYERLVMVGDGATDMEAAPPADAFIGFGGNQVRESVRLEAPYFAHSFHELIDLLNHSDQN